MVGVVSRVEEVVVQRAVEPVVEELHGPGEQQCHRLNAVGPPRRQVRRARDEQVAHVEEQPVEDDLLPLEASLELAWL